MDPSLANNSVNDFAFNLSSMQQYQFTEQMSDMLNNLNISNSTLSLDSSGAYIGYNATALSLDAVDADVVTLQAAPVYTINATCTPATLEQDLNCREYGDVVTNQTQLGCYGSWYTTADPTPRNFQYWAASSAMARARGLCNHAHHGLLGLGAERRACFLSGLRPNQWPSRALPLWRRPAICQQLGARFSLSRLVCAAYSRPTRGNNGSHTFGDNRTRMDNGLPARGRHLYRRHRGLVPRIWSLPGPLRLRHRAGQVHRVTTSPPRTRMPTPPRITTPSPAASGGSSTASRTCLPALLLVGLLSTPLRGGLGGREWCWGMWPTLSWRRFRQVDTPRLVVDSVLRVWIGLRWRRWGRGRMGL